MACQWHCVLAAIDFRTSENENLFLVPKVRPLFFCSSFFCGAWRGLQDPKKGCLPASHHSAQTTSKTHTFFSISSLVSPSPPLPHFKSSHETLLPSQQQQQITRVKVADPQHIQCGSCCSRPCFFTTIFPLAAQRKRRKRQ